ncbi:MAG: hypothetical protein Q7R95_06120 [bacterium]|nr:hypothetical protein [bacterium]
MKNRYYLILVVILSVLLMGCNTPMGKWIKGEKTVEKTKQQIVKNDDRLVEKTKGYLYGADFTLSLAPTNRYVEVAKGFTERGLSTIGQPEMQEVLQLKKIVNDLLSTNKAIMIQGEEALAEKDLEVVSLQKQNTKLEEKLLTQEEKLKEVNRENASLATTWKFITRGFWWIVWIGVAYVVFRIAGAICPPPYNSFFGIFDFLIGGCVRLIFKAAPKAMGAAKVVGQEVKVALDQVVTSVEDAKTKIDSKNEAEGVKSVGLEQLKTELRTNTDDASKKIINRTKENLGFV